MLSFEHGWDLPDPDGLLEFGRRRQVGYVPLRPGQRTPARVIGRLVDAAIEHGLARRAR